MGTYKLYLNIRAGVSRVSFILLSECVVVVLLLHCMFSSNPYGSGLGFFFLMVIIHILNLIFLLIPVSRIVARYIANDYSLSAVTGS